MDTSKVYVKMCEKLPLKDTFKIGDHVYSYDRKMVEILIDFEQLIGQINSTKLYHQDQLQEMIPTFNIYTTLREFEKFVNNRCFYAKDGYVIWNSMEQLWLAFVMKEKFGKVWNGTQWVHDSK